MEYDYLFKILIIGDSSVGKTSIMNRYTSEMYNDEHISTVGVDFKIKLLKIDGFTIKLHIWDTAGQERFRAITKSYYKSADAFIFVYDVSNMESFENIRIWLKEVNNSSANNEYKVLVGNKTDLEYERQVGTIDGQNLAKDNGMSWSEASVKNGQNINEIFTKICKYLILTKSPNIDQDKVMIDVNKNFVDFHKVCFC